MQPEAFLKQVLKGVADMNKNGPFIGKWSLKEEYNRGMGAVQGGEEGEEDEDDVEMEDVPLGNQ